MKKSNVQYSLILICFLIASLQFVSAQPPIPSVDDGMIVVPLGGILALASAALAYGIHRKNKTC